MFYACGWGDEDGKPTYGYHGEDGCIKKNMFDGTLCLFLNLFFSFNHSIFFKKLLIKFKKEKYMRHFFTIFYHFQIGMFCKKENYKKNIMNSALKLYI